MRKRNKNRNPLKKISRRDALKKGGKVAAGTALAAAVPPLTIGCSKEEKKFIPEGSFISSESLDSREVVKTDLLIVGSGFAGLWAAIAARDQGLKNVTLVDKGSIGKSSVANMTAGGTIFCEPGDEINDWIKEFVEEQRFLSRQDMVSEIFATSHSRLRKLMSWGVWYQRTPWGAVRLSARGFRHIKMYGMPRWQDMGGGKAVIAALSHQVEKREAHFFTKIMITDLLQKEGRITGAVGFHRITGQPVAFSAPAVILAAGDCSFRGQHACVDAVTGDAYKLAYDAGVRLTNMEHLVSNSGSPRYGIEGQGVGVKFGAKFRNAKGEAFMKRYHRDADKAEVNYIAQAMANEVAIKNGPPLSYDMSGFFASLMMERFFTDALHESGWQNRNYKRLRENGVDLFAQPQEWYAHVQKMSGGVRTDINCMSDLPGLFAAGNSQSVDPGLFQGWSSMKAMWSGEKAGTSAARFVKKTGTVKVNKHEIQDKIAVALKPLKGENPGNSGIEPDDVCRKIQDIIFPYTVSICKSENSLTRALNAVQEIKDRELSALYAEDPHQLVKAHETFNMVQVAEMYLRSSLERKETRADHQREDYPETNNRDWLKWINVRKRESAQMGISLEDVPLSNYRFKPQKERSA
ncbi:MAG: FAD-binding protein [Proteobacteria bacterium]|nr:FAD-binding protein [Pseudomonadota bacterium]